MYLPSHLQIPRDPRFQHTSGTFDPSHFRAQYGFLADMHLTELTTLKDNLKRARKLLQTSPRDVRAEREAEVQRLERAVKRGESTVHRDTREKVEEGALERVRKEERERRREGKGAWYLKEGELSSSPCSFFLSFQAFISLCCCCLCFDADCVCDAADKRELLTKAKYEALAGAGGRGAVRKAIERKQRKVNQKEKKRRPFVPGEGRGRPNANRIPLQGQRGGGGGAGGGRGGEGGGGGGRPSKRQRTS